MANISTEQIAHRVLDACLAGELWQREDVDALVDSGADELFTIIAEGLADRFDPKLSERYAEIFSHAIARVDDQYTAEELLARYRHVRRVWPYRHVATGRQARILEAEERALRHLRTHGAAYRVPGLKPAPQDDEPGPERIVLLSRITLGADIAVTSIVAQALKARFPYADVVLAGSRKSAELLGLELLPMEYPKSGGLRERLRITDVLIDSLLVIDPDSRLTQLGMYPVVPQERYYFFDSRSSTDPGSLVDLARAWCAQVFDVDIPRPKIVVPEQPFAFERPAVTVSFGVGGNEIKRVDPWFERALLRELSTRFATVIVDKGAGDDEAAAAEAAAAGLSNVRFWSGSFAAFASLIAGSDLYVGYDSAGQHAAAALGVPLISMFAGAVNDRFFERWKPEGRVVRLDCGSPESAFIRIRSALNTKRLGLS